MLGDAIDLMSADVTEAGGLHDSTSNDFDGRFPGPGQDGGCERRMC